MKNILINILILMLPLYGFTQAYTISGYVEDTQSGEKLIGANIYSSTHDLGTSTNVYGFYSLTLPSDSAYILVSYIGYTKKVLALDIQSDLNLNIQLIEGETLESVEITAEQFDRIEERTQMSQVEVPITQIKKLPVLLGETDVLKALQLLPGVQSGGEGTSGIYVRGGSPDQNLILIDGVPVYNASHLFGFFSVFNADAIKNVTLTKGGYPARYGGRLSSVLEINMKEGNMKRFRGEGSIGLISSKITLEGPIEKDVSSFMVSARRTYIDALSRPILEYRNRQRGGIDVPGYFFYDVNAKVNRKFGDKDRVYLSFYGGDDKFSSSYNATQDSIRYNEKTTLNWGNIISSVRWNHQFSNKLFSNLTGIYSQYDYGFGEASSETYLTKNDSTEAISSRFVSEIQDIGMKLDFDYVLNPKHYIRFGGSAIHHTFRPGVSQLKSEITNVTNSDTTISQKSTKAFEFATYIEDQMNITKAFKANVGIHVSAFLVNEKLYHSIQPRIGLSYKLPNDVALKASYANMTQYIHLLTSGGLGLASDLWVPTTENIVPQDSWQVALGAAKTFKEEFEVSFEAYYKGMNGLLSYREGVSFLDETPELNANENNSWQDKVTQGSGNSYGAELFIQKKKGNTTGWVGYTLSWTNRQFDDINNGERFPFKYDRRHDLSVVVSHKLNKNISISGSWVFGTGNAITLPSSKYLARYPKVLGNNLLNSHHNHTSNPNAYDERTITDIKNINNARMRNYHRLDISVEFYKKKPKYERTWSVGAYNIYSRANPFYVQVQQRYNEDLGVSQTVLQQYSLFPIIPSVAWKFKF